MAEEARGSPGRLHDGLRIRPARAPNSSGSRKIDREGAGDARTRRILALPLRPSRPCGSNLAVPAPRLPLRFGAVARLAALLFFLLLPTTSRADEPQRSWATAQAVELTRQGREHEGRGETDTAIRRYLDAVGLDATYGPA